MQTARDALTPDALGLLQTVARAGSFAAAARTLGLVPSALTYRVRKLEDALDVLLFDRGSRQARFTPAGSELLREGARLLGEIDAVANRVKRVATGWESAFTIAADGLLSSAILMELAEAFFALGAPTRLSIRDEVLAGTLEALTSGQADLTIGVPLEAGTSAGLQSRPLGQIPFVFAVAPTHPLATAPEPLSDDVLLRHRAIAVADSVQRGAGLTIGLQAGQDVFTVSTLASKVQAQLRGLGAGFLPEPAARGYIAAGQLVVRQVVQRRPDAQVGYAWRRAPQGKAGPAGRALSWWLAQLDKPATQRALLERHQGDWLR
ncbi:MAG: LysR substrate-binding domain-containing protein [Burkholderiales bacterium]